MVKIPNRTFVVALDHFLRVTGESVDFNGEPLKQDPYRRWRDYIQYPITSHGYSTEDDSFEVSEETANIVNMLANPDYKILMKIKAIKDADNARKAEGRTTPAGMAKLA